MNLGTEALPRAALELYTALASRGLKLVLAESCTGGLAAASLTAIPGSSQVLWGGIVSYSVEAKTAILRVPPATIQDFGVVSTQTAEAMARGSLGLTALPPSACLAGAVTGFAGPGTEAGEDGPGRVCLAWTDLAGAVHSLERTFPGDRDGVRTEAALALFQGLLALLSGGQKAQLGRY